MAAPAGPPFGRLLTAMVTPFAPDGSVDLDAAAALAVRLVEDRNDGLVVNGTGGEAPTTTDAEKADLVRAVVDAVGDRAHVVAGIGTNDTAHTLELAAAAEKAGADGLLAVTPYYSKPPQAGLLEHFRSVADATGVPVMLYDIPHRAGTAIATETLIRLAEHPRVVAVKDALTLPMLAVGGAGVVGTSTHFCGPEMHALIEAALAGDHDEALRLHRQLLPILTGIFATQGVILVKAGLELQGRGVGSVRLPMVPATAEERTALARALEASGLRSAA